MKKVLFTIFVSLIFSLSISAKFDSPLKVDEFSEISNRELKQKLVAYATEFQRYDKKYKVTASIIVYSGKKYTLGFPFRYMARIKNYLIQKGIPANRIISRYGGEGDFKTELYLTPGEDYTEETPNLQELIPNKSFLFDSYSYYNKYRSVSSQEITGSDLVEAEISLKVFAETLKKQPFSKAYVFVYGGTNLYFKNRKPIRKIDSQKLLEEMIQGIKERIVQNGVETSRIVIAKGGYKDSTRSVELWLVPEGDKTPKPKPNYFLKNK